MAHFQATILNEEIQELPLLAFRGKIHLVEDSKSQKMAVEHLARFDALGFDTESRPSFQKGTIYPVSLLQLSTEEDAFLFRLNKCKLGPTVVHLLENSEILKIGVAIDDDLSDLKKLYPFEPGGFLPLEKFVKQAGIESNGLRKLAAIILKGRITKSAQVSNWSAAELNQKQQIYAATDAWVGLMMYKQMITHGFFEHP